MINVIYYTAKLDTIPAHSYWDQALITDILQRPVFKNMQAPNGAVIVLPGAYQGEYIKKINDMLAGFEWVVLLITSDEESKFPVEKIKHPNIKIWVQYPKKGRHDKYAKLPLGYTTETRNHLSYFPTKELNVFYSGQKSHERRKLCSNALHGETTDLVKDILINDTPGFSQGFDPSEYMNYMCNAKIAPSPSGPVSADSFRTYEALEAGAVPIADTMSLAGDHDYWRYLFGEVPYVQITNYDDMYGYIKDALSQYPALNNEVLAWWIKKKRDLMWKIVKDIEDLSGAKHTEKVTAIIPVSPIKSHPSTDILEETVRSIRFHLPSSEIIITFDGVREEQEHMRKDYEEFTRKALFLCNTEWNAVPIIFKEHTHQVGMARVALEEVKTPVILYCEQDTPLVIDEPIDWNGIDNLLFSGQLNVCRFHFEAVIPEPHKYLMLDREPIQMDGVPIIRTAQWSQRPLLITTAFLKHITKYFFTDRAKTFYEDRLYSLVAEDYLVNGLQGWNNWRVGIYAPKGNYKRSLNLDGRAGDRKFDKDLIF